RAVKHGISDDDRFFRHDARIRRRADDQVAARQALADIIVGISLKFEGDAAREPGAEALAGRAGEADMYRIVGQPLMAVALGYLARKHAAAGAVGVANDRLQPHWRAAIECGLRVRDQLAVEDVLDLVVLRLALVDGGALFRRWLGEQFGEV